MLLTQACGACKDMHAVMPRRVCLTIEDCWNNEVQQRASWRLPCKGKHGQAAESLCMHDQGDTVLGWVIKRGRDVEDLTVELAPAGQQLDSMDSCAAEELALHASNLQNLRRLTVWKPGAGGGYDAHTACGVGSALLLLLTGLKKLEELTLRVPLSLYMPPLSNIKHLTCKVFQIYTMSEYRAEERLDTVVGAFSARACASLTNLRGLQTLTLSKAAHPATLPHNFLKLQELRLQSLLLDGVPLQCVRVASSCTLHMVLKGSDMGHQLEALSAAHAASAAVQTLCATLKGQGIFPGQALRDVLTCLSQLTHLQLDVTESSSGSLRLGDAAPQLEVLKLTGDSLAVTLGSAFRLRVLWVCANQNLQLHCDMPDRVAGSLTYVHIAFSSLEGSGVSELLSSMQAAGKRVHPAAYQGLAGGDPQSQRLARYPQDRIAHMMQLLCMCHVCLRQSINDRIQACPVQCGNLRLDHTGKVRYMYS